MNKYAAKALVVATAPIVIGVFTFEIVAITAIWAVWQISTIAKKRP